MSSIFYKPSGKFNFFTLLIIVFIGILWASLLNVLYLGLQWFIPFVYLNILLTIGLGYASFSGINVLHKLFKLRNVKAAFISTTIIILVSIYIQWVVYVLWMFNEDRADTLAYLMTTFDRKGDFVYLFSHPNNLLALISTLNEQGTLTINGQVVSNVFLLIIWIIEALLLIIIPLLMQFGGQVFKPFSESSQQWMKKRKLLSFYPYVEDIASLEQSLLLGDTARMQEALPADELPSHYAQYFVFESPEDDYQYLVVENIRESTNKKGERQKDEDTIIEYLRIKAGTL